METVGTGFLNTNGGRFGVSIFDSFGHQIYKMANSFYAEGTLIRRCFPGKAVRIEFDADKPWYYIYNGWIGTLKLTINDVEKEMSCTQCHGPANAKSGFYIDDNAFSKEDIPNYTTCDKFCSFLVYN